MRTKCSAFSSSQFTCPLFTCNIFLLLSVVISISISIKSAGANPLFSHGDLSTPEWAKTSDDLHDSHLPLAENDADELGAHSSYKHAFLPMKKQDGDESKDENQPSTTVIPSVHHDKHHRKLHDSHPRDRSLHSNSNSLAPHEIHEKKNQNSKILNVLLTQSTTLQPPVQSAKSDSDDNANSSKPSSKNETDASILTLVHPDPHVGSRGMGAKNQGYQKMGKSTAKKGKGIKAGKTVGSSSKKGKSASQGSKKGKSAATKEEEGEGEGEAAGESIEEEGATKKPCFLGYMPTCGNDEEELTLPPEPITSSSTSTTQAAPTTEAAAPTTEAAAPTTEAAPPTTEAAPPTTEAAAPTTEEEAPTTEADKVEKSADYVVYKWPQ